MKSILIHCSLLVLLLITLGATHIKLNAPDLRYTPPPESEALYLPRGSGLKLLSFGYQNFIADILWFNTINYFGKHYKTDHDYRWLGHMCNLVTSLDPGALHVYKFGATMLTWEVGEPEQSVALLDKAIEAHPGDWHLYFLRGFTYLHFLGRQADAVRDFKVASTLPDAPVLLTRISAKLSLDPNNPQNTIKFLRQMIEQAKDANARKALEERLRETIHEVNIRTLQRAITLFKSHLQRPPKKLEELIQSGIVSKIDPDPFGGRYYIDETSGELASTSKRSGFINRWRSKVKRGSNER